jgi:hypothetical protein
MGYAAIPAAVFVICAVVSPILAYRIRKALNERHPGISNRVLERWWTWFTSSPITEFAWAREDELLRDRDLTNKAKQLRLTILIAYCAWGAMVLMMILRP